VCVHKQVITFLHAEAKYRRARLQCFVVLCRLLHPQFVAG